MTTSSVSSAYVDSFLSVASRGVHADFSYPSDLQKVIDVLLSEDETKQLLDDALKMTFSVRERLQVIFSSALASCEMANFSFASNTLSLNECLRGRPVENILPYVIFELQNAKQRTQYLEIESGMTGGEIDNYVERIERCEYQSGLATHYLVQNLIQTKVLPSDAPLARIFSNFRDYYLFHQVCGHSQMIAERYAAAQMTSSSSYRGTWKHLPSSEQIPILKQVLCLKLLKCVGSLEEKKRADEQLKKFIAGVKEIMDRNPGASEPVRLFENVFFALEDSSLGDTALVNYEEVAKLICPEISPC
ncbi:MAG: hypothetical protein KF898_06345 [Parachlamydiales bacterium]|nr:hypothetical protein [Candidatus Acheromyda pituitae]